MGRSRTLVAGLLTVLALLAAGCGDDDDGGDGEAAPTSESDGELPPPSDSDLSIEGFEFNLSPVPAGAEVSFVNLDGVPHTLTAEDDTFDTGSVAGGESATFTAPDAGEYPVLCTIHPQVTGTLVVE